MKRLTAMLYCAAACAFGAGIETTTFPLPSGSEAWVNDYRYVVVAPSEWDALTNRIALLEATASRRLAEDYKTVAGREIWHGKATNRVVNADGLSVTWLYADGFQYTELEVRESAVKRTRPPQAQKRPSGAPATRRPLDLPPRLAAKRAAILARQQGKAPTVNATFGPGGKVIKVEEPK